MKRTRSLLCALCLLVGMVALPVSAEQEAVLTTDAFDSQVKYSVTDSNLTGWGLGFCFTLNAEGVKMVERNSAAILTNATMEYAGETCKISRIGAVVTHLAGIAADDTRMVREFAVGRPQMKDVRAAKLYKAEKDLCRYAVRVVDIPFERENDLLYARPYVEIMYQGEKVTLYGTTVSASYADKLMEQSLVLPYYGTDVDGSERLFVGDTAVIEQILYLEIQDELDDWMVLPNDGSFITFGFFDAAGNPLGAEEDGVYMLPELSQASASAVFKIEMPVGTAEVRIVDAQIRYWSNWE